MSLLERAVPPRPLRRRMSPFWWLGNLRYTIFFLREFSAVFLAFYMLFLIVQLALLVAGPDAYRGFHAFITNPWWIALNVIVLLFALIHTLTWLGTIPAVTPMRVGELEAPSLMLLAGALGGFVVASVAVGLLLLWWRW